MKIAELTSEELVEAFERNIMMAAKYANDCGASASKSEAKYSNEADRLKEELLRRLNRDNG